MTTFDRRTLDTLQMRLDAIAQGMQETLFQTAVSPVVREGADASCALFTATGELLALSEAIPLLLGALPGSVAAVLDRFPAEDMVDGDMFFMNDPFAGGTHLPDIAVVIPVFSDGRLIALAASNLHHQDIGGMRPGSVPPDATDIFQEGIRFAPTRLGHRNQFIREAEDLIRLNSRAPDTVLGDLSAQAAAAEHAARSLRTIAGEIGEVAFLAATNACLDLAEEQTRRLFDCLPDGPYVGIDGLDPLPEQSAVEVRVALSFKDARLIADFSGSSPQVDAPINCVRSGTLSAALYATLSLAPSTLYRNGGILRLIQLVLPNASVVNAAPPAAVNARMGMVRCITSAMLQAVSKAAPDHMPAANSGMSFVMAMSGNWPSGCPFVTTEIIAGGAGAGPDRNGADAVSTDVGNAMNMPGEALEEIAPVRLLSARIRQGSGGAGLYRGGNGIRREYEALADDIGVSLRGDRFVRVPTGLLGGGSPQPAKATIIRADGETIALPSRSAFKLDRGDRLIVESCGGAGYGKAIET